MGVFVRTSKSTGVAVPWIVAPFLALGVVAYWVLWFVVMLFVWTVVFSARALRWGYEALQVRRSGRDTQRPGG